MSRVFHSSSCVSSRLASKSEHAWTHVMRPSGKQRAPRPRPQYLLTKSETCAKIEPSQHVHLLAIQPVHFVLTMLARVRLRSDDDDFRCTPECASPNVRGATNR